MLVSAAVKLCEHRVRKDVYCARCARPVPAVVRRPLSERRLDELELVIERGLATFVEVGQALMEIRDGRLYRDSHGTFEDYCRDRWNLSRPVAYRMIDSAQVAGVLSPMGDIQAPANERQARELAPLLGEPERLQEAWAEVVAEHPEPTAADIRDVVQRKLDTSALLGSSESDEWYTPSEYVEAARRVMGGIDLDPASCEAANEVVRAERIFTIANDGLAEDWRGRVFMNPPYGNAVGSFVSKLVESHAAGYVHQAVLLTAARLETRWFAPLFDHVLCFPSRRVRFWQPGREVVSPPFTPAFVYLGPDTDRFIAEFSTFGPVVSRVG